MAIDRDGSLVVANECGAAGADGLVRVLSERAPAHVDLPTTTEDVLRTPERVALDPAGNLTW